MFNNHHKSLEISDFVRILKDKSKLKSFDDLLCKQGLIPCGKYNKFTKLELD